MVIGFNLNVAVEKLQLVVVDVVIGDRAVNETTLNICVLLLADSCKGNRI